MAKSQENRRRLREHIIDYLDDEGNKIPKQTYLTRNPEKLIADSKQGENAIVTNLLLYTHRTDAWHNAICVYYVNSTQNPLEKGRQIKVNVQAGTLTVNVYNSGMVMFQGAESVLVSVLDSFDQILQVVERPYEFGGLSQHSSEEHQPEREQSQPTEREQFQPTEREQSQPAERAQSQPAEREQSQLAERGQSQPAEKQSQPTGESSLNLERESSLNPQRESSLNPQRESSLNPQRENWPFRQIDNHHNLQRHNHLNLLRDNLYNLQRDNLYNLQRDNHYNLQRHSHYNLQRDIYYNLQRDYHFNLQRDYLPNHPLASHSILQRDNLCNLQ
ncbi:uncharacterized protein LOC113567737 [Electrophorus electricus]|uniref:uncharacterized protein LOC113567737 n=1 Tax=Electrophorus electricus TaxID=8005 RepID=UPI0015CFEFC7|nr:uncharacterized protein LOC113567737 [Electrophorus electricus]